MKEQAVNAYLAGEGSFCRNDAQYYISRSTLNNIIDGKINSVTTFEKHICKILNVLDVNKEDLVKSIQPKDKECYALYSCNESVDYFPTKTEI